MRKKLLLLLFFIGFASAYAEEFIYVGCSNSTVESFSVPDYTMTGSIPVGSFPIDIALADTINGIFGYVVNTNSNNVTVFDTSTNGVITTIAVGIAPSQRLSAGVVLML